MFIKQYPLKIISGNKWLSAKDGAKVLSGLVLFSIFYSGIPLGIQKSIREVPFKYLMYYFGGVNTKEFWNTPEEKILYH